MNLNDAFHLELSGISGNELITSFLSETLKLLHRGMAQFMLEESMLPNQGHSIHHKIVESLKQGRLDEALNLLKEDICSMEQKLWEAIS